MFSRSNVKMSADVASKVSVMFYVTFQEKMSLDAALMLSMSDFDA
jgi:hypothetical protein